MMAFFVKMIPGSVTNLSSSAESLNFVVSIGIKLPFLACALVKKVNLQLC
jgi:hypothetical protein